MKIRIRCATSVKNSLCEEKVSSESMLLSLKQPQTTRKQRLKSVFPKIYVYTIG